MHLQESRAEECLDLQIDMMHVEVQTNEKLRLFQSPF